MFPYISDTGATPPESNIFGQCLNIGAVMMLIALYIRYKQIDYDIRTKNITLNPIWNKIGIIFGIIACLGMSVVGNFPELTLLIVHLVGALMAFGVGILYLYVQTWISSFYLNARQRKISKALFYMRLFMVCLLMPLMISIFVFGYLSFINFHGKSYLLWTEEDGGYGYRLVSVFSEWFLYILVFVYIATFSTEFGNIKSTSVVLQFKEDP
ncbi:hypothetical protein FQR65_LT18871 [Abscondita terminalis]|nr:hypothetical protein FQR65_LT08458 [Abscondita terminalis]KAF5304395.1 hypothetical protein FQR65_LT18871 [Abscondita terminalis]